MTQRGGATRGAEGPGDLRPGALQGDRAQGFAATVARHWGGADWPTGNTSPQGLGVGDRRHDGPEAEPALEAGAAIASVEFPVMADFDDPGPRLLRDESMGSSVAFGYESPPW